jgi:hypothetical protein
MSNKCWYRLNIDVTNALNPNWKFTAPPEGFGVWQPRATEIFNKEWLQYTASLGLPIYSALVFYRGPFMSSKDAHHDTHAGLVTVNFGLNWVIGGAGSKMHWFDTPTIPGTVNEIDARAPYVSYPFSELTEIDNCNIGPEITLVKTCNPHSISMQQEPRWAISARTNINDNTPWDEVVELIRSKNLLVERQ